VDDIFVRPGDFIKVQPRDEYFAALISPMMMVYRIINDMTIIMVDGNIIDLSTFKIVYVNGKDFGSFKIQPGVDD
jgi:hypothetical protein